METAPFDSLPFQLEVVRVINSWREAAMFRAKAVMGVQVKTIRNKIVRHEYLTFKLSNNASALEIPCQTVPDILLKDHDLRRRPPYLFTF